MWSGYHSHSDCFDNTFPYVRAPHNKLRTRIKAVKILYGIPQFMICGFLFEVSFSIFCLFGGVSVWRWPVREALCSQSQLAYPLPFPVLSYQLPCLFTSPKLSCLLICFLIVFLLFWNVRSGRAGILNHFVQCYSPSSWHIVSAPHAPNIHNQFH